MTVFGSESRARVRMHRKIFKKYGMERGEQG